MLYIRKCSIVTSLKHDHLEGCLVSGACNGLPVGKYETYYYYLTRTRHAVKTNFLKNLPSLFTVVIRAAQLVVMPLSSLYNYHLV